MNITVSEIMHAPVMTITRHETAGHATHLMTEHSVSALPVVGPDDELVGIVTTTDLLDGHADATPVSAFMTKAPITVPSSEGPHTAARIMRNHHVHHVVVADHGRVVGMVSSFDLLRLVEDHRFQMKQAPTASTRKAERRT